jgi:hypothetical protein
MCTLYGDTSNRGCFFFFVYLLVYISISFTYELGIVFSLLSSVECSEQCLHLKALCLRTLYIEPRPSQGEGGTDHLFFGFVIFICTLISIVEASAH